MNDLFRATSWDACTSALLLDRLARGELGPSEAETVRGHIASCTRCAAAAGRLEAAERLVLPPLRPVGESVSPLVRARARWGARIAGAGLALATAAGLMMALRVFPVRESGTALKGTGHGLSMYVQHGSDVRRAGPGEIVAPGDAIRFTVTTRERSFLAVLSLDATGAASVYFPLADRAAPIEPGVDTPLPVGTRLDRSVGEERIWAYFCREPVEVEPLRARLEATQEPSLPSDCQVVPWRFVKR